jgi:hypothetical protein
MIDAVKTNHEIPPNNARDDWGLRGRPDLPQENRPGNPATSRPAARHYFFFGWSFFGSSFLGGLFLQPQVSHMLFHLLYGYFRNDIRKRQTGAFLQFPGLGLEFSRTISSLSSSRVSSLLAYRIFHMP